MNPNVFKMSLGTLAELGRGTGGAAVDLQFQEYLSHVIQDCIGRPHVTKARQLTMKMMIEPTLDELGHVDGAMVDFTFEYKCPSATSRSYSCAVTPECGLAFSNDRLDDIKQATFAEVHRDKSAD